MFDAAEPLWLRLLSLFHVVVPVLLPWAIRRLGYDPRGWKLQTAIAWVVLPVTYLSTDPYAQHQLAVAAVRNRADLDAALGLPAVLPGGLPAGALSAHALGAFALVFLAHGSRPAERFRSPARHDVAGPAGGGQSPAAA